MVPHPERISPWKVGWLRLKLVTLLSFWFESMDGFPWIYFHPGMWPSWDSRECHHSGRQVSWLSWVASPSGGRFFMGWNPRCKKNGVCHVLFWFFCWLGRVRNKCQYSMRGWTEELEGSRIAQGDLVPGFKVLQEDQFTLEMKVPDFSIVLSCIIRVRENYRNCSMMYCIYLSDQRCFLYKIRSNITVSPQLAAYIMHVMIT